MLTQDEARNELMLSVAEGTSIIRVPVGKVWARGWDSPTLLLRASPLLDARHVPGHRRYGGGNGRGD